MAPAFCIIYLESQSYLHTWCNRARKNFALQFAVQLYFAIHGCISS